MLGPQQNQQGTFGTKPFGNTFATQGAPSRPVQPSPFTAGHPAQTGLNTQGFTPWQPAPPPTPTPTPGTTVPGTTTTTPAPTMPPPAPVAPAPQGPQFYSPWGQAMNPQQAQQLMQTGGGGNLWHLLNGQPTPFFNGPTR